MESQMKRLKDEADIGAVVRALGIPTERKGASYFIRCPSPKHKDDTPSAYFKEGWNNIYCNSCCRAFKALDLIMFVTGMDVKAAADYLWELEGRPGWFVASKEERERFSLTPGEARHIGLRPSGEAACLVSASPVKEPLGAGESYDPHRINGYVKFRRERLSWRDFMTGQEYVRLVAEKAAEAAGVYQSAGLLEEEKEALRIRGKALAATQKTQAA